MLKQILKSAAVAAALTAAGAANAQYNPFASGTTFGARLGGPIVGGSNFVYNYGIGQVGMGSPYNYSSVNPALGMLRYNQNNGRANAGYSTQFVYGNNGGTTYYNGGAYYNSGGQHAWNPLAPLPSDHAIPFMAGSNPGAPSVTYNNGMYSNATQHAWNPLAPLPSNHAIPLMAGNSTFGSGSFGSGVTGSTGYYNGGTYYNSGATHAWNPLAPLPSNHAMPMTAHR